MNDTPGWASPGSAAPDGDANGSAPQWSQNQPPAGRWQPPAAPGPGTPPPEPAHGGPGWGAQPPYGQWGAPPIAKPGVIPLRPLTMSEILDGAVTTLRRYWRTVLTVTVTVAVIMQVADILAARYLVPARPKAEPSANPAEALRQSMDLLRSSMIGMAPAYVIMVAATLISAALLTVVISRAVVGRPIDLATAWREARPRLLQLLGLTLLVPLAGGAVVLVGMLPGLLLGGVGGDLLAFLGGMCASVAVIWLGISFSLASPALMLERQGVFQSLKRSAKLVRGSWWRVFGVTILAQLLMLVVGMVVSLPFTLIAVLVSGDGLSHIAAGAMENNWSFLIITGIGGVVASALAYPVLAGVTVLLYIDQRIRREALDIELARAAGLPGYGG